MGRGGREADDTAAGPALRRWAGQLDLAVARADKADTALHSIGRRGAAVLECARGPDDAIALSEALEKKGSTRHRWPPGRWGRTVVDHRDPTAGAFRHRDLAPSVGPLRLRWHLKRGGRRCRQSEKDGEGRGTH